MFDPVIQVIQESLQNKWFVLLVALDVMLLMVGSVIAIWDILWWIHAQRQIAEARAKIIAAEAALVKK